MSNSNNTIPTFETNAENVRQWILDNRSDLLNIAECEFEFWGRVGTTDIEGRKFGQRVTEQENVALVDISESGEGGEWRGLVTMPDGRRMLALVADVA